MISLPSPRPLPWLPMSGIAVLMQSMSLLQVRLAVGMVIYHTKGSDVTGTGPEPAATTKAPALQTTRRRTTHPPRPACYAPCAHAPQAHQRDGSYSGHASRSDPPSGPSRPTLESGPTTSPQPRRPPPGPATQSWPGRPWASHARAPPTKPWRTPWCPWSSGSDPGGASPNARRGSGGCGPRRRRHSACTMPATPGIGTDTSGSSSGPAPPRCRRQPCVRTSAAKPGASTSTHWHSCSTPPRGGTSDCRGGLRSTSSGSAPPQRGTWGRRARCGGSAPTTHPAAASRPGPASTTWTPGATRETGRATEPGGTAAPSTRACSSAPSSRRPRRCTGRRTASSSSAPRRSGRGPSSGSSDQQNRGAAHATARSGQCAARRSSTCRGGAGPCQRCDCGCDSKGSPCTASAPSWRSGRGSRPSASGNASTTGATRPGQPWPSARQARASAGQPRGGTTTWCSTCAAFGALPACWPQTPRPEPDGESRASRAPPAWASPATPGCRSRRTPSTQSQRSAATSERPSKWPHPTPRSEGTRPRGYTSTGRLGPAWRTGRRTARSPTRRGREPGWTTRRPRRSCKRPYDAKTSAGSLGRGPRTAGRTRTPSCRPPSAGYGKPGPKERQPAEGQQRWTSSCGHSWRRPPCRASWTRHGSAHPCPRRTCWCPWTATASGWRWSQDGTTSPGLSSTTPGTTSTTSRSRRAPRTSSCGSTPSWPTASCQTTGGRSRSRQSGSWPPLPGPQGEVPTQGKGRPLLRQGARA